MTEPDVVVQNDIKIPEDGERCQNKNGENENHSTKNSQNYHISSKSSAESIETTPEPPKSTVTEISASETSKTDKSISNSKIAQLQQVVNAIDHYQIDMEELALQQTLNADFQRLSRDARTGLSFRKVAIGDSYILVDVSNGPARPFVPQAFRRKIFDAIHGPWIRPPGHSQNSTSHSRQICLAFYVSRCLTLGQGMSCLPTCKNPQTHCASYS